MQLPLYVFESLITHSLILFEEKNYYINLHVQTQVQEMIIQAFKHQKCYFSYDRLKDIYNGG